MTKQDHGDSSILRPEATGGVAAETGFAFQNQLIAARVPGWLRCTGFSSLIREGLGDAEARIFSPSGGDQVQHIEYKTSRMTPVLFWDEVSRFEKLASDEPTGYLSFLLVCRELSDSLQGLMKDLGRIGTALPFYDGLPAVAVQSQASFVDRVLQQGKTEATARFMLKYFGVELEPLMTSDYYRLRFRAELDRCFPKCQELPTAATNSAYEALTSLIQSRLSAPIKRTDLEGALWDAIPSESQPTRTRLRLHTCGKPEIPIDAASAIVFEWCEFFGGQDRSYPTQESWNRLTQQLSSTRSWIERTGRPRKLVLTGERRLSPAVAFGAAFSAVSGFHFEVEHRGNTWATDSHADESTQPIDWQWEQINLGSNLEAVVVLSICREIRADVKRYIEEIGLSELPFMSGVIMQPLKSDREVNLAVIGAKRAVIDALRPKGVRKVHLFLATPSPFAFILGHRLNSLGQVQLYEHQGGQTYCPTCLIDGN